MHTASTTPRFASVNPAIARSPGEPERLSPLAELGIRLSAVMALSLYWELCTWGADSIAPWLGLSKHDYLLTVGLALPVLTLVLLALANDYRERLPEGAFPPPDRLREDLGFTLAPVYREPAPLPLPRYRWLRSHETIHSGLNYAVWGSMAVLFLAGIWLIDGYFTAGTGVASLAMVAWTIATGAALLIGLRVARHLGVPVDEWGGYITKDEVVLTERSAKIHGW